MAKGPVEQFVNSQTWIDPLADAVQPVINNLFNGAGAAGRTAKDFLNGVWLGHSLHATLSDVPIGAWMMAEVLDAASASQGDDAGLDKAADLALGVGVVGAVAAAATGLTDWSEVGGIQRKLGLTHALINVVSLVLNASSLAFRVTGGSRSAARVLSATGFLVNTAAAYVGGELVYRVGQGVNRDAWVEGPEKFTAVGPAADLAPGRMQKYDVDGTPVVVIRHEDGLHAFAGTCPHFGAPLWEGELADHCVTCPWHGSQFDIRDGALLHGPSTHPIPSYQVRESKGQIEVRIEGS